MNSTALPVKKLLIMAAGTGGHIFPGLAIADEMQQRGWTVSWLGTAHGMEAEMVPKHGIEFNYINFSGVRGKGLIHTLKGLLKLVGSFFSCWRIFSQRKPDLLLGMGGYVTVPGGLIGTLRKTPLVLMNADAALLLSNKVLRPLANKILFGLPPHHGGLTNKDIVTGNAIRSDISTLERPQVRYAGRDGALRILVVGGSLGARVLNETIPAAMALLHHSMRPMITHQSGKAHIAALKQGYAQLGVDAEVVDFIDDMPKRYAQADLVICRAGAITVSELTAAGVASILIPLVVSSTSHQVDNARWMEELGAAIHLPQSALNAKKLAEIIQNMTREQCARMAEIAYSAGQREASQTIATILEKLV